jgi:hypothetical protein
VFALKSRKAFYLRKNKVMIFTLLMSLFSLSLDLLAIIGLVKSDKDLEIIILRQQVRLLQTQNKDTPADI